MSEQKLPPEMTEVLVTSHFAYLCTTDADNQPHISPMFFIFDEKTNDLYVVASSESKKMKNLRANPKISLTIDIRDDLNPFNNRGVMVQGKAMVEKTTDSNSVVKDGRFFLDPHEAFQRKYPVLQKVQSPVNIEYKQFSETLIKIAPSRMVYWRGPNFITVNFDKHRR